MVLFLIQSYEKKTISIISSLASRLFMLIPILTILTGIENIIQITVLNILSNNNLFETKIEMSQMYLRKIKKQSI